MKLGKLQHTNRGFERIEFKDYHGAMCSLQQSSISGGALWLGPNKADPQVLASQAHRFGVQTSAMAGWVPYPVPNEVLMTTRMHLDRKQVSKLVKHLQAWLDNGSIKAA